MFLLFSVASQLLNIVSDWLEAGVKTVPVFPHRRFLHCTRPIAPARTCLSSPAHPTVSFQAAARAMRDTPASVTPSPRQPWTAPASDALLHNPGGLEAPERARPAAAVPGGVRGPDQRKGGGRLHHDADKQGDEREQLRERRDHGDHQPQLDDEHEHQRQAPAEGGGEREAPDPEEVGENL